MPITMANTGDVVYIKKILGSDAVRNHLAELGFVVDAEVKVIKEIEGSMILQVHGAKVALSKSMANRIII